MTNAFNPTSLDITTPYLTVQEYKDAPTALQANNLIAGNADQAAQDAELANVILRASAWIDRTCHQSLNAQVRTESKKVVLGRGAELSFMPNNSPIISLSSLAYGGNPNALNTVDDCSLAWIDGRNVNYPASALPNWLSSTALPSYGGGMRYIRYSYTCGYVNSMIGADVIATATSLTMANPAGVLPSQTLVIADGVNSEQVSVSSSYVFGASPITLSAPLAHNHKAGIAIYSMPASIKEAAILVTSAFIKVRGSGVQVASSTSAAGGVQSGSRGINTDLDLAHDLLNDFIKKF